MRTSRLRGEYFGLSLFLLFLFSAASSAATPNRVVLGYSASWFDGIYPIESYNFGALTHIARAFLVPKADGSIQEPGGFWDQELDRKAHAYGVKLLASLGGAAPDANNWLTLARDPKALKLFFDSLEKIITAHNYDGVDVDWEPSALTDADQETFTTFMKALRTRFPHWIITTALGASDYYGRHISWAEVAAQVDWINWMTYDFAGNWSEHSAHDANLYPPKDSKADTQLSIDQSLSLFISKYGLPPDKVVLGLPFFGVQFFTKLMGDPFIGDKNSQGVQIQYSELAPLLEDKSGYKPYWDEGAQAPYLENKQGGYVVTYDNPKSIALKCDYAVKRKLKGVMIWNLGADVVGETTPLLDAVAQANGTSVLAMPPGGLVKTLQNIFSSLTDIYGKLQTARGKLTGAGKTAEAKAADPGPMPQLTVPDGRDPKAAGNKIWELQCFLSSYERKLSDCQIVLDALPVKEVKGQKLEAKDNKLLIDDFEKGGSTNALGGNWTADCDHNNLGTVLNPQPFTPSVGGTKGSEKFSAHISGHLGKSMAPWPYAELVGTLTPSAGAADLGEFKTLEFWTKGNGKDYSVLLGRAAVEDYANPRNDFKAQPQWTKVILNLVDFKQPTWGRQIPIKFSDILYIAFSPSAGFSDEDFDIWVDDIELGK